MNPAGTGNGASPPMAMNCDAPPPCYQDAYDIANYDATMAYQQQEMAAQQQFLQAYEAAMFNTADNYYEDMQVTYPQQQYHYTLYFYDQAGNLTHTVSPAGVNILPPGEVLAVENYRNGTGGGPDYVFQSGSSTQDVKSTDYQYNSVNEQTSETTPDAGLTTHYYDKVGRLRFSQNAQQAIVGSGPHPVGYLDIILMSNMTPTEG